MQGEPGPNGNLPPSVEGGPVLPPYLPDTPLSYVPTREASDPARPILDPTTTLIALASRALRQQGALLDELAKAHMAREATVRWLVTAASAAIQDGRPVDPVLIRSARAAVLEAQGLYRANSREPVSDPDFVVAGDILFGNSASGSARDSREAPSLREQSASPGKSGDLDRSTAAEFRQIASSAPELAVKARAPAGTSFRTPEGVPIGLERSGNDFVAFVRDAGRRVTSPEDSLLVKHLSDRNNSGLPFLELTLTALNKGMLRPSRQYPGAAQARKLIDEEDNYFLLREPITGSSLAALTLIRVWGPGGNYSREALNGYRTREGLIVASAALAPARAERVEKRIQGGGRRNFKGFIAEAFPDLDVRPDSGGSEGNAVGVHPKKSKSVFIVHPGFYAAYRDARAVNLNQPGAAFAEENGGFETFRKRWEAHTEQILL